MQTFTWAVDVKKHDTGATCVPDTEKTLMAVFHEATSQANARGGCDRSGTLQHT